MAPLAVLMDHDGGVDDYLATVLLMTMAHVDPLAVLTTAYLGRPDLFERRSRDAVVITEGASQGRIKIEAGGRTIHALDHVDTEKFYEYVLQQWAR